MRTRSLCTALAVAALTTGASAHAASITYRCAPNLCRIAQDGSAQQQLTTDGQSGTSLAYGAPSLSRDGTRLSFTYDSKAVVSDANAQNRGTPFASGALLTVMRPDGGALLELEAVGGSQVCTYNLDGSARNCPYGTGSAGWAPDNKLLISVNAGAPYGNQQICHVPVAGPSGPCSDVRASDVAADLYDPAVSPDGATLAVTATSSIGVTTGHIALYNYATGVFERALTAGTTDQTPAWSPDDSTIAFVRGGSIYTIAAGGASGTEHLLAAGDSPSWGPSAATPAPSPGPGTTPPGPTPTTTTTLPAGAKLARLSGSIHLTTTLHPKVSCTAACRIAAKLTIPSSSRARYHLSSATLATASKRLSKAGSATLSLKLSATARRRLRHHRVTATLTVTITDAANRHGTLTRHVTVAG